LPTPPKSVRRLNRLFFGTSLTASHLVLYDIILQPNQSQGGGEGRSSDSPRQDRTGHNGYQTGIQALRSISRKHTDTHGDRALARLASLLLKKFWDFRRGVERMLGPACDSSSSKSLSCLPARWSEPTCGRQPRIGLGSGVVASLRHLREEGISIISA